MQLCLKEIIEYKNCIIQDINQIKIFGVKILKINNSLRN